MKNATSSMFEHYMYRVDNFANFLETDHSLPGGYYMESQGIDITNQGGITIEGFPIFAQGNGTVQRTGYSRSMGYYVIITYNENNYTVRYLHLFELSEKLEANDPVDMTMIIGITGDTGRSDGPHLHFDVNTGGHWDGNVIANNPNDVIRALDTFPSETFRN